MNSVIKVNQALHGYANGHQLIASSVDLSADDKRLMDELRILILSHREPGSTMRSSTVGV